MTSISSAQFTFQQQLIKAQCDEASFRANAPMIGGNLLVPVEALKDQINSQLKTCTCSSSPIHSVREKLKTNNVTDNKT